MTPEIYEMVKELINSKDKKKVMTGTNFLFLIVYIT